MARISSCIVVSLFNAINNAKKEAELASQHVEDKHEDEASFEASHPTKNLALTKIAHKKLKPTNEENINGSVVPASTITAPAVAKKWSVLKDDPLSQTKLSMKVSVFAVIAAATKYLF